MTTMLRTIDDTKGRPPYWVPRHGGADVPRGACRGSGFALVGLALAANVFLAVDEARAGGEKIYVAQNIVDRLPLYTDRPIDGTSKVILSPGRGSFPAIWRTTSATRLGRSHSSISLEVKRKAFEPLIERAARTHGVEAALLYALIEVESGFEVDAVSPKGATGLAQMMPATAARYGKFNLLSAEQNIEVSTRYLRDLLRMFDGNMQLALAGYNAGENAVIRHGFRIPPYSETQHYVPAVLERYRAYRQHLERVRRESDGTGIGIDP